MKYLTLSFIIFICLVLSCQEQRKTITKSQTLMEPDLAHHMLQTHDPARGVTPGWRVERAFDS